jgi:hypothetical protein
MDRHVQLDDGMVRGGEACQSLDAMKRLTLYFQLGKGQNSRNLKETGDHYNRENEDTERL